MIRSTTRVARWFVFKPKIQIWVNFGGSRNGRRWYILRTLGPFYGLLLFYMDIWYSSWKFGIFFPVLVFCTKKNLATLVTTASRRLEKNTTKGAPKFDRPHSVQTSRSVRDTSFFVQKNLQLQFCQKRLLLKQLQR
jgi:hypothetical protein